MVLKIHQKHFLKPNIDFICSSPGAKLLKELWNQQKPSDPSTNPLKKEPRIPKLPTLHLIKQQKIVAIGHGYQLHLIPVPTARWPGGLVVFEKNLGLLMSGKFFAAHICTADWAEKNRSINGPSAPESKPRRDLNNQRGWR